MKFLSYENLLTAYKNAFKPRKYKYQSYLFRQNLESNLVSIFNEIKERRYIHSPYRELIINDSKKRYISSPSLKDHILHHMIHNILYPALDKRIPSSSYATRLGMGAHKSLKYIMNKLYKLDKSVGNEIYYLKIDLSKYFYSIHHHQLKQKVFRFINNDDLRYAINVVIDSYKTPPLFDNLFPYNSSYNSTQNKGIPIGAILSQLLANFYLYDLDRYILQQLKPYLYIRYMDDMIFMDTKENLLVLKEIILKYINSLKLNVNPKKIVFNKLRHGVNLLGYYITYQDKPKIMVNKVNKKKLWKDIDKFKNTDMNIFTIDDIKRFKCILNSRVGMFKITGEYDYYLEDYLFDNVL